MTDRPEADKVPVDKDTVFKIIDANDWREASASGRYHGSADDRRDGYIHLSAAHQLSGTLAKHFHGRRGLLLVAFDAQALGLALKWEPSRGGDLFPHLYAALPTAQALWTRPLELCEDGTPALPPDLVT